MNKETSNKIYDIIRAVHTDNNESVRNKPNIAYIFGELYEAVYENEYKKIVQFSKALDIKLGCNIAGVVELELENVIKCNKL